MFEVVEPQAPVNGRRGLLTAATELTDGGNRWPLGFTFDPYSCEVVGPLPIDCVVDAEGGNTKGSPGNAAAVQYKPFLTLGADKCSVLDRARDRRGRAEANLRATEEFQMEREFWAGVATEASDDGAPNAYLTKAGLATDVGTGALPAVLALAALEQAMAECLHGQRGMVHAVPYTVDVWAHLGLLTVDGSYLLTPQGNIVVSGSGYTGDEAPGTATAPDVAGGDPAFAFGTGIVYVRRGPIVPVADDEVQRIDTSTNTYEYIVERPAAVTMSGCCVLKVEVDHTASLLAAP